MTNHRVGSVGAVTGSSVSLFSCWLRCLRFARRHKPRSSTHHQRHHHTCAGNERQSLPPTCASTNPSCRRANFAAQSRKKHVKICTRSRPHSAADCTRRMRESRAGNVDDVNKTLGFFPRRQKPHKIATAELANKSAQNVMWKVVERWQSNSRPYTRWHMHICQRGVR